MRKEVNLPFPLFFGRKGVLVSIPLREKARAMVYILPFPPAADKSQTCSEGLSPISRQALVVNSMLLPFSVNSIHMKPPRSAKTKKGGVERGFICFMLQYVAPLPPGLHFMGRAKGWMEKGLKGNFPRHFPL